MLPKTIDCTLTAVPRRPRMSFSSRYLIARSPIQLLNTASIASSSCLNGSCGKSSPTCLLVDLLVALDDFLQAVGVEIGVELRRRWSFFTARQLVLEVVVVDAHDGVAEHVDQPAIAVVGEALVAGELGQALDDLVVQADVQHRVHHARHRHLRARAGGDEQRVLRVAELLAGGLLDLGDVRRGLRPSARAGSFWPASL